MGCQLNPICQHDFGIIFWQSPGGIQLFQELVKKSFHRTIPAICLLLGSKSGASSACAQQKKKLRNFSCMCHRSGRCMPILAKPRSCPKNLERLKQTPVVYASKNKLKFLS